jgi:hypothetical protein
MGSRYILSGVQLGLFQAMAEHGDTKGIKKLANEISENQWYKDSTDTLENDVESLKSEFFGIN